MLLTALRYNGFKLFFIFEKWLVVLFFLPWILYLHLIPQSLAHFSSPLSLSLFQQGADTQGRGAQNQPGRTDRARDGERGRERKSWGLWVCDSQKRERVPQGKGERGRWEKRRDLKREIRENYTEAMEEKNCHKSTLSSSQLDLLDPHVQYETLKSI